MGIIAELTNNIHMAFHEHPIEMIGLVMFVVIAIAFTATGMREA